MLLRSGKSMPIIENQPTRHLVENANQSLLRTEGETDNSALIEEEDNSSASDSEVSMSETVLLTNLAKQLKDLEVSIKSKGKHVSSLVPQPFSGLSTEDHINWLRQFKAWLLFEHKHKEAADIVSAFQLLLKGTAASWFNSLPLHILEDADAIFREFEEYFAKLQPKLILEQQLWERSMSRYETLDSYIADIDALCSRLNKNEADKITIFIRGLLPELRSLVIPQRPTDWLSCIQAALTAVQASIPWTTASPHWSFNSSTLRAPTSLLEQQTHPFNAASPYTFYASSSHGAIPPIGITSYQASPITSPFVAPTAHAPINMQPTPTSSYASTPWFSGQHMSQPPTTKTGASSSASSDDLRQQLSNMQSQISDITKLISASKPVNVSNVTSGDNVHADNVMPICQICNKYGHAAYKCYAYTGHKRGNSNRFNNYRGRSYYKNSVNNNNNHDTKN